MTFAEAPLTLIAHCDLQYDKDGQDDFIAAGGFAEVYKARLKKNGQTVALKLLYTPSRLTSVQCKALVKEATILQKLGAHSNIVELIGLCMEHFHYGLVLEYVKNGSLPAVLIDQLDEHPAVNESHCRMQMGLDVAVGMEFLHAQTPPVIHRDLKSDNVLVGNQYNCKIADFGLAKTRGISTVSTLRRRAGRPAYSPSGTLAFIAPERFTQEITDDNQTKKADVYSFAIVLWQLKEMKAPYEGENSEVIRSNVIYGRRPNITSSPNDETLTKLVDLINKCWVPDIDTRPSFSDIASEMRQLLNSTLRRETTLHVVEPRERTFSSENSTLPEDSQPDTPFVADGKFDTVKRIDSPTTEISASGPVPVAQWCQSQTRGNGMIRIWGLPPHATANKLIAAIKKGIKDANGPESEVSVFKWAREGVTCLIRNFDSMICLWRCRHKNPLCYNGRQFNWDLDVSEEYERDRILVTNVPQTLNKFALKQHIKSAGVVGENITMSSVLLHNRNEAIVFFSEPVADADLVENLTKKGSHYQGTAHGDICLTYGLVPVPRSVRLRGLEDGIDKNMLQDYFERLTQVTNLNRTVLVDDIKTSEDGLAIVTFRTVDDCHAVLSLPQMPSIGLRGSRPLVEAYSEYPRACRSPSASLVNSASEEAAHPTAVYIQPKDPVVMNFICKNRNHLRRFKDHLCCNEIEWDGCKVTIVKPSYSTEVYEKMSHEFANKYLSRTVLVRNEVLWETSLNFAECEKRHRSAQIKIIAYEKQLEIQFVGPKSEVIPFHQLCANQISAWLSQLQEETATIPVTLPLPSVEHLRILQRSPSYQSVSQTVQLANTQTDGGVCLSLQGPVALVQDTKEMLLQTVQSIALLDVTVDKRIAKFLAAVGLHELNTLYENFTIGALAIGLNDDSIQLLSLPGAVSPAEILIKTTYDFVIINITEQMQSLVRSREFEEFLTSLCINELVMLDPDVGEIRKAAETALNLFVVGERSAARLSATLIETFIDDNVFFTERIDVVHPGVAKFLMQFKADQLATRFSLFKATIEVRQREQHVILRATRSGISNLEGAVRKLLVGVEGFKQELKKPGVVRFLFSDAFKKVRSRLERESNALIWIDGQDRKDQQRHTASPNQDVDVVSLTVFTDKQSAFQAMQTFLLAAVEEFCVEETHLIAKLPVGFDKQTTLLKALKGSSDVCVRFEEGNGSEFKAKLVLSGFKEDVAAVHLKFILLLNKAAKEEGENVIEDDIFKQVCWYLEQDDFSYQQCSNEAIIRLETARADGQPLVRINNHSVEYEVDIDRMIQTESGRKLRRARRSTVPVGDFPSWWFVIEPEPEYDLHLHKLMRSDQEFLSVQQAFRTTGGKGTIVSIERIQNPQLYRRYVNQKSVIANQKRIIASKRQQNISSRDVPLEVKGFHGAAAATARDIAMNGFSKRTRSTGSLTGGQSYEVGVYFSRMAQRSCEHSPPDENRHRRMFYCQIILGLFARGSPDTPEPFAISDPVSDKDKCASTVDIPSDPNIFVSCYRDNAAYPTHLITFM